MTLKSAWYSIGETVFYYNKPDNHLQLVKVTSINLDLETGEVTYGLCCNQEAVYGDDLARTWLQIKEKWGLNV